MTLVCWFDIHRMHHQMSPTTVGYGHSSPKQIHLIQFPQEELLALLNNTSDMRWCIRVFRKYIIYGSAFVKKKEMNNKGG